MSENKNCKVHGANNANDCQNLSGKDAEKLGKPELTVDPENCSCDVGVTGPAGDEALLAKGSGAYDHPQPIAKGPAADPDLLAKSKPPILNPGPEAAQGPGK